MPYMGGLGVWMVKFPSEVLTPGFHEEVSFEPPAPKSQLIP